MYNYSIFKVLQICKTISYDKPEFLSKFPLSTSFKISTFKIHHLIYSSVVLHHILRRWESKDTFHLKNSINCVKTMKNIFTVKSTIEVS